MARGSCLARIKGRDCHMGPSLRRIAMFCLYLVLHTIMGSVSVQQCGPTYYQRVSTGYQVVAF